MPVLESSLCRAHYTLAYSDVVRCYCCARCLSPVIAVEALRHLAYLSVQYEPGSTWSRRKDQASYLPTYSVMRSLVVLTALNAAGLAMSAPPSRRQSDCDATSTWAGWETIKHAFVL